MLATPPDLRSYTRFKGRRAMCWNSRCRIPSCTRLLTRVAIQRPHTFTNALTSERTRNPTVPINSSCQRSVGMPRETHAGFRGRSPRTKSTKILVAMGGMSAKKVASVTAIKETAIDLRCPRISRRRSRTIETLNAVDVSRASSRSLAGAPRWGVPDWSAHAVHADTLQIVDDSDYAVYSSSHWPLRYLCC